MKINWLWDTRLSEARVKEILHDENNPRFYIYAEKLFSRINDPQEAFGYISKEAFCKTWPAVKKRIEKDAWFKARAGFWQTIYERLLEQLKERGFQVRKRQAHGIQEERLNIAQQIKNLRIKKGYSQKEMAKRLGVIQQYVSKLEAGSENLTVDTLKRIAKVLDKKLVIRLN